MILRIRGVIIDNIMGLIVVKGVMMQSREGLRGIEKDLVVLGKSIVRRGVIEVLM